MNIFFTNTSATYTTFLINKEGIKATGKKYPTPSELLAVFDKKEKLLELREDANYNSISKVIPSFDTINEVKVYYTDHDDTSQSFVIPFNNREVYDEALPYIIEQAHLHKTVEKVRHNIVKPILYALIAPILTFALYMASSTDAPTSVSGNRKGMKRLLIAIAEMLGANGILIVGTLISIVMIYWAYKKIKASSSQQEVYIKK